MVDTKPQRKAKPAAIASETRSASVVLSPIMALFIAKLMVINSNPYLLILSSCLLII